MRLVLTIAITGVFMLAQQVVGARHALLIGCSDYKSQPDLPGCGNDVALLRDLLVTPRFGFANADITVLSDADPTTKRPTYENIVASFTRVASGEWALDAAPDVLLVYMAGHGGQRFSEAEKDGKDEFFLPIDESDVILDDQVGLWLNQLNNRGIHVWIVFDSCFSGTMTRGGESETMRGIPSKAQEIVRSNVDVGWELPDQSPKSKASCVAFYACQAFERAIEDRSLDRSSGKPTPHGLFSYCLLQCLGKESDGQTKLTYETLHRRIIDQYRRLGRTWPTPFCEGPLDQEVLGFESWPKSSPLFLSRDGRRHGIGGW